MSAVLKSYILQELRNLQPERELADGQEKLANALAKAIERYLDQNVTVAAGIAVSTVGTPTAQQGTTTTPGKIIAP